MHFEPFVPAHHPEAAVLIAQGVGRLRHSVAPLPAGWQSTDPYLPHLERLQGGGSGVAAIHDGDVVGFMAALQTDWGAGPIGWTPEWAWAVSVSIGQDRRRDLIRDLYAAAAARWAAAGAHTHWLSVLSDDADAVEALVWLGFGHHVVNAIRDLSPLEARETGIRVRRAEASESGRLAALEDGLREHLSASPVFLRLPDPRPLSEHRRRIADPARAVLFAEVDGEIVGYLLVGPVADDVALIVQDPATASITGAFVLPAHRRRGVAEGLLGHAIEWARRQGYDRLGVDFESANLAASRFWLRYFTPITFTLVRRLGA